MITAILIRGVTLDGAAIGIEYYMKPDLGKLGDLNVNIKMSE